MKILENTSEKLVLASGGWPGRVVSTFDKQENVAHIVRHVFFWRRLQDIRLTDIDDVRVTTLADPASGAERHIPVVHATSGSVVPLSGTDEENAGVVVEQVRRFLQLAN